MPNEPDPTKTKDPEIDVDAMAAAISAKVDEKMTDLDQKMSTIINRTEPKPTPTKKEDDDPFDFSDVDDDDRLTKKDVISIVEKAAEKIYERITSENQKQAENAHKQNMADMKAFEDFPLLDSNKRGFDPKFKKAVEKEMSDRIAGGKSKNDVNLLYDASAAVYSKWAREGKVVSKKVAERLRDKEDRGNDNFNVEGGADDSPAELTSYQKDLAKRYNMKPERVAQRLNIKGKT